MTGVPDLPPERPGRPAPPDLAERRAQMGAAIAAGAFATARPPVETTLAGLRTLRLRPAGPPRGYLLQFHGGGYRIGRPEFEAPYGEALAARCGVETVVPQYRLAPEAPFPAAVHDGLAALTALRGEIGEAPLILGGDSAGAGLAAAVAVHAAAHGGPRIDALVLLSPWLDLTVTAPAYARNAASDPLFSTGSAQVAAELYLQGHDATHPLASPLFAPLAGLPPTLVSVGTGEVLHDDSRRFHARLLAAGLRSELHAIDGMEHVAVVRGADLPGSRETFAAVTAFIDTLLPR